MERRRGEEKEQLEVIRCPFMIGKRQERAAEIGSGTPRAAGRMCGDTKFASRSIDCVLVAAHRVRLSSTATLCTRRR